MPPDRKALASLFSISASLLVCFVAMGWTLGSFGTAAEAYGAMFQGGLGDWSRGLVALRPLGESATKASLLCLTGLSLAVALTVGLFNLGAHGQFLVGALVAALVGAQMSLPWPLHWMVCLLLAAAGGAAYAWFPAFLKHRRGVHEVISTIMLNWIAASVIENWWVIGPLNVSHGTKEILPSAELPRLFPSLSRLHAGFLVALAASALCWLWLRRSAHGFETRAVGASATAAQDAGLPVSRRMYQAMLTSGGLAGLAGAVWILGTELKFPLIITGSYGFDGIAMALLGQGNPFGIAAASLFFGILRAGGTTMQLFGVHKSFPELIQGFALLFIAAGHLWSRLSKGAPRA